MSLPSSGRGFGDLGGLAFNDHLGYEHAWNLAEIRDHITVDGRPFMDRDR